MDPSILQSVGAQPQRPVRFSPIYINRWFTGLVTQRNPMVQPGGRPDYRFYGGRPDTLLGGLNMEITNAGTLKRRPGLTRYTSATFPTTITSGYAWSQISSGGTNQFLLMIGTNSSSSPGAVYNVTPTAATPIWTNSAGAGQTFYNGVGGYLYFGNGIDLEKYDGNSTTKWGIVAPVAAAGAVSEYAGTGADAGFNEADGISVYGWGAPGNIVGAPDGLYAQGTCSNISGIFIPSNSLNATNYSFSLPAGTIVGIAVNFTGHFTQASGSSQAALAAALIVNGAFVINSLRFCGPLNKDTDTTIPIGGPSDTWGNTVVSTSSAEASTFGVSLYGFETTINTSSQLWFDSAQIILYVAGGPIATPTGTGTFSATSGYEYVICYGSSASGHISSPSEVSNNTGPFGGSISTSSVASAGTGYSLGDTGILIGGTNTAAYLIGTVGGGGEVLTYSITNPGANLSVQNNVATSIGGVQPGVGAGFTIDITAVVGVDHVALPVVASTDPQVNQIWVFRTDDGGSTFFNLPTSPYLNTTTTIHDSAADSTLQNQTIAPSGFVNNPPPAGLITYEFHASRSWGSVGNKVYYSTGPDTILGNPQEAWNPANVFVFPAKVYGIISASPGLLVFTATDVYIIRGTISAAGALAGSAGVVFYSQIYIPNLALASYNAFTHESNQIFVFTANSMLQQIDPSGLTEPGFAIGDLLGGVDPTQVYITSHVGGSTDRGAYLSDGATNVYRMNPNQPPEGGACFSPVTQPVGGVGFISSLYTSSSKRQLLFAQGGTGTNTLSFRDLTTSADNGAPYLANALIGQLVLSEPGELAEVSFITTESKAFGTRPTIGVLLDEISGATEALTGFVPDPPQLTASTTLFSDRYYLVQGNAACLGRTIQINVAFPAENQPSELLTLTIGAAPHTEQ